MPEFIWSWASALQEGVLDASADAYYADGQKAAPRRAMST